jgi:hypothetical protein
MYELDFQHLFALLPTLERGAMSRLVLGGFTEDMVEQFHYFFLRGCFTVSIGGGVRRFVIMV